MVKCIARFRQNDGVKRDLGLELNPISEPLYTSNC
jgi:hypothetical protein